MLVNEILINKYTVIYGAPASGKTTLAVFTVGREALERGLTVAVATKDMSASSLREYLPTLQHVVERVEDLPPVDVAIVDALSLPWSKDIPDLSRARTVIETRLLGRTPLVKAYIHESLRRGADLILKMVEEGAEVVESRQFETHRIFKLALVPGSPQFRRFLEG